MEQSSAEFIRAIARGAFEIVGGMQDALAQARGLRDGTTIETPRGLHGAVEEQFLGGTFGLVSLKPLLATVFERGGVLGGQDELLRGQAVLQGVLARLCLAFLRAGAGTFESVETIGGEAGFSGGHCRTKVWKTVLGRGRPARPPL